MNWPSLWESDFDIGPVCGIGPVCETGLVCESYIHFAILKLFYISARTVFGNFIAILSDANDPLVWCVFKHKQTNILINLVCPCLIKGALVVMFQFYFIF